MPQVPRPVYCHLHLFHATSEVLYVERKALTTDVINHFLKYHVMILSVSYCAYLRLALSSDLTTTALMQKNVFQCT